MSLKTKAKKRGGVMVLVAVLSGVLLGSGAIGLDYGRLALARWKLQTAADAGALAGVAELAADLKSDEEKKIRADSIASSVASRNGSGSFSVSFPGQNICQVNGTRTVNLTFAKALGILTSTVNVSARAGLDGVGTITGIRPLGIEEPLSGFLFGETYLLKLGPHDDSDSLTPGFSHHGNFHALALGGRGASNYREKLKFGYDGVIKVGDWLTTEPGNMSGPTNSGVNYIMDQDLTSWEWYESNPDELNKSPRLITVPVLSGWSGVVGRSDVHVAGFAAFFLEGTEGHGKDSRVFGRFVKKVTPYASSSGGGLFGAYTTKLIQ